MQQQPLREKSFWPYAIVTAIILCILACAWTVKIAIANPVELDSFYLEKYQDVDRNINEIMAKQELFDAKFALAYKTTKFVIGKDEYIRLAITDKKAGSALDQAKIELMVTRPDTNAYNQTFTTENATDGVFTFGPITVEKPGRWQLLAKVKIGTFEGFNKYEVYATK